MRFLHAEQYLGPNDSMQFRLSHRARVMLLDSTNFSAYQNRRRFTYYGGWAQRSPLRLAPPYAGHWHAIVDLDGRSGTITASMQILRRA